MKYSVLVILNFFLLLYASWTGSTVKMKVWIATCFS